MNKLCKHNFNKKYFVFSTNGLKRLMSGRKMMRKAHRKPSFYEFILRAIL